MNIQSIIKEAFHGTGNGLDEALGNLNTIANKNAKKALIQLLRHKTAQATANITQNSSVELLGKYPEVTDVNKALKRYTNLGHRVGAIVVIAPDGDATVIVIVDADYHATGNVSNNTQVRSTQWHVAGTAQYRLGEKTTLGKAYRSYSAFNERPTNVEVYAILVDGDYALTRREREANKQSTDKYAPTGSTGATPFMRNARERANELRVERNSTIDIASAKLVDVVKFLINASNAASGYRETRQLIRVDNYFTETDELYVHSHFSLSDILKGDVRLAEFKPFRKSDDGEWVADRGYIYVIHNFSTGRTRLERK